VILQGKTVIVSGVGVGLGKEVAKICLRDGASATTGQSLLVNSGEMFAQ
jgi:NAD(P)-dependent dehydrogenase (short-subunit alcohol dehydrogenase family)